MRADVDRIVVIKPSGSRGLRAREIYHSPLADDDDDRDRIRVRVLTRGSSLAHDSSDRRKDDRDDDRPKRSSKRMRPLERAIRKSARRQSRVANFYLALHDRSNRRKKNGWRKDLGRNVMKACRRGMRLRFA